ncbi:MAG: GYD domain-containing protein [Acidobacteriota bacterium]|jgi:uncharacterized protein with GYD domain|nr:GYD domain-containing protein [Acidobacteriota bacterium]
MDPPYPYSSLKNTESSGLKTTPRDARLFRYNEGRFYRIPTQTAMEGTLMPMYITLYNWTEQGIRNVKDAPARIRATCQSAEAAGGRVLGVFLTMGQYDLVAVSEAPDDESYAASLLAQGMMGNVRSTSLRAFTTEEFEKIVNKLPV